MLEINKEVYDIKYLKIMGQQMELWIGRVFRHFSVPYICGCMFLIGNQSSVYTYGAWILCSYFLSMNLGKDCAGISTGTFNGLK